MKVSNRFVSQAGTILTGNEAVRYRLERLVSANPEIRASDAARRLGVSRQRIHQICRSSGLTMTRAHKPGIKRYCPCTRELSRRTAGTVCAKCRNKLEPLFCADCGAEVDPAKRWNARNRATYPTGQYTGRVFCAKICPTMLTRRCPCGTKFQLNYYQRTRVRQDGKQYKPRCPECRVKGA